MAIPPPELRADTFRYRLGDPALRQPAHPQANPPAAEQQHDEHQHEPAQEDFVVLDEEPPAPDRTDQTVRHGQHGERRQQRADGVGLQRAEHLAADEMAEAGRHAARRAGHASRHQHERTRRQPELPMGADAGRIRLQPECNREDAAEQHRDQHHRPAHPAAEPGINHRQNRGQLFSPWHRRRDDSRV